MSFVLNDAGMQQMSFLDSYNTLTDREKKFLEKSRARYFAEHNFPKIDEKPYAVFCSGKDSRPNTPVNVQVGVLILKKYTGLSDDDIKNIYSIFRVPDIKGIFNHYPNTPLDMCTGS